MANWPRKLTLYVSTVVSFGVALALHQLWNTRLDPSVVQSWIVLAVLNLLCELFEVVIIHGHAFTAGISVTVAAAFIGGPQLATLVVLTSTLLAELWLPRKLLVSSRKRYLIVVAFNTAQLVISVVIAGLLCAATSFQPSVSWTFLDFARALLAFIMYLTTNLLLVSGAVHFSEGVRFWPHFWTSLRIHFVQALALGFLAILLAIVHSLSPWYSIIILLPLFIVQMSLREHVRLRVQVKQAFEKIAQIVSTRDPYTGVHSEKVAELAIKPVQALQLPQGSKKSRLRLASMTWERSLSLMPSSLNPARSTRKNGRS